MVTFTVASQQPGREVRRSCVKPTRKNLKARKCTRLVKLAGKITEAGKKRANRFTFIGKIGGRRLGAGTYTLTLTPSGGTAVQTTFRLTD